MSIKEVCNIVDFRMDSYPAVVIAIVFLEIAEWEFSGR